MKVPHRFLFITLSLLLTPSLAAEPSAVLDKEPDNETRARQVIKKMEQLYRGDSSSSIITMKIETPQYERLLKMEGQSLGQEFAFFRFLSTQKRPRHCDAET